MNDLVVVERPAQWDRLKQLVLDSVSSPITKRLYNMALNEFLQWFRQAPRPRPLAASAPFVYRATKPAGSCTFQTTLLLRLREKILHRPDLGLVTTGHYRDSFVIGRDFKVDPARPL